VRLAAPGLLLRGGARGDAARAAVVAGAVDDRGAVDHRLVVDVGDVVGDVGHRAVVVEVVAVPVAAVVAAAAVTVAVVDAAVEAHVATPVAGVEDVDAAAPAPVARGPQRAD